MSVKSVDASRFKFRCEVDWIELELRTFSDTQAWRLRDCSGFSYVRACNQLTGKPYPLSKKNTPTTLFWAKAQDPKSWSGVKQMASVVNRAYPLALPPKVIGIEVAFDAYSKGATRDELAELAAHFFKFLSDPVSENHRIYRDYVGSGQRLPNFSLLVASVLDGWQIGIGHKNADQVQHCYFKTTDGVRNKVAQPLPESKHRARIEVTLRGAAISCQTEAEWAQFKFQHLTKYFNFRKLKPNRNVWVEVIHETQAKQTGRLTKEKQKNYRIRREFGSATQADTVLNDKAKGALRRLSDRWCKV
ncbi:MAG: hypothetical protein ACYCWB_06970 [Thiobacillus sp.]